MKTKLCLLSSVLCLLAFTGCTQIDKTLYHAGPPKVIGTNVVTTPAYTDTNGVAHAAATNFVPVTVPGEIAPDTAIEGGINLVKVLPIPFAAPIAIALGWLYSAYASIRNKKALVAVVKGVDAGREFLNTTSEGKAMDAKLKDFLIQHQEAAGVLNAVSKVVNEHTGNTVQ